VRRAHDAVGALIAPVHFVRARLSNHWDVWCLIMPKRLSVPEQTGFDFGQPTYRFGAWIASYDGSSPLLDVGAGLGERAGS
jgi:hypothetical protein